jgi:hypothetical protein
MRRKFSAPEKKFSAPGGRRHYSRAALNRLRDSGGTAPDTPSSASRAGARFGQNRHPSWPDFLRDNVAVFPARNRAVTEIYQAVAVVLDAFTFENGHDLRRRIREQLADGCVRMDLQAALELVSPLVADLPQHHADARRLREVARRTQSVTHLKDCIDELVADYKIKIKINRGARFRNGLTHGGAAALEVAATIRVLVNGHARLTARTALQAVLEGRSIKESFEKYWVEAKQWRRHIPTAKDISDALFEQTTH